MKNLDSLLRSRDITLLTKVLIIKAMVFPVLMYGYEGWTIKKFEHQRMMLLNFGVGEDFWESLGCQGDQTSQSYRKSTWIFIVKEWCWSWSSNILTTLCEQLTHWKRPWSWQRLRARGEEGDRGWGGWIASLTQRTWVWANPGRQSRTGRPGVLQSMVSQRIRHDLATEQQKQLWHSTSLFDNY